MRLVPWLVVAVACSNSKPDGSAPPPAKPKPSDCEARANAAAKFLTTMDHEPNLIYLKDVQPVVRTDLALRESDIRYAPVIMVEAARISYEDRPLVATELKAAHDKIISDIEEGKVPKNDPPDPRRLNLVIDQRAPGTLVARAVATAYKAGFDRITVVFGRPPKTPPPPHTKVDDDVAKLMKDIESGNKATALAEYTRPKVAGCPTLIALFGEVGTEEQDDKAGYLLKRVGPALIGCNCAADPAEITSLMWAITGNPHPVGAIDIVLDPKAKQTLALGAATWSDASAQLHPDATTIWVK
jgi:hypothetical protein